MKACIDTSSVKVILDTNALMVPEQFGVDIFSELLRLGYVEWQVPASVLEKLAFWLPGPTKEQIRLLSRVALGLAEGCYAVGEDNYNAIRLSLSCPEYGRSCIYQ